MHPLGRFPVGFFVIAGTVVGLAFALPALSTTQAGPLVVTVTTSPNPYAIEGSSSVANSVGVLGYETASKGVALEGFATKAQGTGLEGFSDSKSGTIGDGVFGESLNGFGVFGIGAKAGYSGVYGGNADAGGVGVIGKAPGNGMMGITTAASAPAYSFAGVVGEDDDTGNPQIGVLGTSAAGSGVVGVYGSAPGTVPALMDGNEGVWGDDTGASGNGGSGVFGSSANNAVYALVTGSNGIALTGDAGQQSNAIALRLYSSAAGDDAIQAFDSNYLESMSLDSSGNLILEGTLTSMSTPQSAPRGASGARRIMYAAQMTQSTAEDLGRATLSGGHAHVALDPAFADLLADANYLVFVTPRGPAPVYVTAQTLRGFDIVAMSGRPSMDVDYRIVGKPRAARPEPRLALLDAHALSARVDRAHLRVAPRRASGRFSLEVMPHGAPIPAVVRPRSFR